MTAPVVLFVVAGLAALVGLAAPALGLRRPTATLLRRAGLLVAVLIAAAGGVFLVVLGDAALDTADQPVLAWLVEHRSPALATIAEAVSLVGCTVGTGALAVVAAAVLAVRGHRPAALIWVVGVAVGALSIRLLKVTVERPRPPVPTRLAVEVSTSLPSGHSLMAALALGLAATAVVILSRARAARIAAAALAVVLTAAIGASRAYLGVHWATDVLAGWLLGSAIAVACAAAASILNARLPEDAARR